MEISPSRRISRLPRRYGFEIRESLEERSLAD